MKVCPKCLTKYEQDDRLYCTGDGSALVDTAQFPSSGKDPMLGRKVAGRFTIVRKIAAGGMGTVYEATQEAVGRPVALKILNQELAQDPEWVKRFKREAETVSLLQSPYTVTLHDFGQDDDGLLFLAMELIQGKTLADHLREGGAMPWRAALEITGQVAESLIEASEKGIVHRDLKPGNVLLTTVGGKTRAKVLDFGIARVTMASKVSEAAPTRTGAIIGTPGYMSPEQATGERADHRTDIYSMGVILYEMLAGKPPFAAKSDFLLMGKHVSAKVPPFHKRAPEVDVPAKVEQLVVRMLAKDPRDRPQSAGEVAESVRRLLFEQQKARLAPGAVFGITVGATALAFLVGALILGRMTGPTGEVPPGPPPTSSAVDEPPPGRAAPSDDSTTPDARPEPRMVTITLTGIPEGSRILLAGDLVEGSALRMPLESVAEVRIETAGYETWTNTVTFEEDRALGVQLVRRSRRPAVPPTPAPQPNGVVDLDRSVPSRPPREKTLSERDGAAPPDRTGGPRDGPHIGIDRTVPTQKSSKQCFLSSTKRAGG